MSDIELCYMTAGEALRRFRQRTLSPVEFMRAVIARAEVVQPKINAFTNTFYEEALGLAKKAEAKFMKSDARLGALEGLPIGIKDETFINGKPTSFGSIVKRDLIGDHTSAINARIFRAGGICHARTAVPEFSTTPYTNSRLWGVTRNPWNRKFTPGGSTGGGAASLAAGTSTLVTGSDIGGSIRIPASACGVVGFKPPHGRNPDDAPGNLDVYCSTGPLARSVADCILLQNVMCGPHSSDITTLRPKLTLPREYKPIRGWKIAYSIDLGFYEVDRDVQSNMQKALDVFRSLGCSVEEVDLGWTRDVIDIAVTHLYHIFGATMARLVKDHGRVMTSYNRYFAKQGSHSTAERFLWSMEGAAKMYATFGPMMEKHDVFICPTLALPAVKADFADHSRDAVVINGKKSPLPTWLSWCMTPPFNTLSRCPVLAVPSGHAGNGVPTGIQIVGRSYCDVDVIRAGLAYEQELGGWYEKESARPRI